jgi:hypothetical protein
MGTIAKFSPTYALMPESLIQQPESDRQLRDAFAGHSG